MEEVGTLNTRADVSGAGFSWTVLEGLILGLGVFSEGGCKGDFFTGVDFLTALGVFFEGVPFFLEDRIGEGCCLDVDCDAFSERIGVFELHGGCLAGVICDFGLVRWTGFDEAIFDTC